MELYELGRRSNIHHYTIESAYFKKELILYDDHRCLLNILHEFNKQSKEIPNLIYFDYHDDCVVPPISIQDRLNIFGSVNIKDVPPERFWNYTEFQLSTLDDDWLTAAMDFGFIENAVCVGVKKDNNVQKLNQRYQGRHTLFTMDHLDWEVGNRGKLGDTFKETEENIYLRTLFQYNKETLEQPFLLDFDLDCFATDCLDKTIAWPRRIFFERYVENIKVRSLMIDLMKRASIITICREPECCGGLGESNKILSYLDDYFFENSLGTQPVE